MLRGAFFSVALMAVVLGISCSGGNAPAPDASPVVDEIAYVGGPYFRPEIWSIKSDGSDQHRLLSGTGFTVIEGLSWAPDGKKMALSGGSISSAAIYVLDLDSLRLTLIAGSADPAWREDPEVDSLPAWSPDGRWIAFTSMYRRDGGVAITDLKGNRRSLVRFGFGSSWSADGGRLFFANFAAEPIELSFTSAGGRFTRGLGIPGFEVSLAPDGKTIAFVMTVTPGPGTRIFLAGADGSNVRLLTSSDSSEAFRSESMPAWSPDGKEIAFASCSSCPTDSQIMVINADGTALRQLTFSDRPSMYPAWKPRPKTDAKWPWQR
jgi:Tol biopolymer transport system component